MEYKFQNKINIIADMGVHALILFTLLTCFFLLYVIKLTKHEMTKELINMIDTSIPKILNEGKGMLDKDILNSIKQIPFQKIKINYNKPDKYQDLNNSWLTETMILTNISLFIIITGTIMIMTLVCGSSIPIGEIIKINILTFIFIAVVEYLFFTRVALHYVPAPPSLMITSIIDDLKKYF